MHVKNSQTSQKQLQSECGNSTFKHSFSVSSSALLWQLISHNFPNLEQHRTQLSKTRPKCIKQEATVTTFHSQQGEPRAGGGGGWWWGNTYKNITKTWYSLPKSEVVSWRNWRKTPGRHLEQLWPTYWTETVNHHALILMLIWVYTVNISGYFVIKSPLLCLSCVTTMLSELQR